MDENIKKENENIDTPEETMEENIDAAENDDVSADTSDDAHEEDTIKTGRNRCKKCGHKLERGRAFCPNCGELREDTKRTKRCKRCGRALDEGERFCPACGMKIDEETAVAASKKSFVSKNTGKESFKTRAKKVLILAVVCVIIIGVVVGAVSANVLFGDDKIAYDLIMDVAYDFKNPSSVRLVSGTVGVDDDCLFCGISATNSFGAKSTEYYFIMGGKDPWIMEQEDPNSLYKDRDELNIKKINKKLEKKLGSE